ncbi:sulfotransferase [Rhodosalinus sp.]|uniref:sulfotransferase n=1 Tax=Rhodosalinus sp. TaxID=2047741 RepID=UPI003979A66C
MTVVFLIAGLVAFLAAIRLMRAAAVAQDVVTTAQDALAVMAAPDLSEDAKETAVRRASIRLAGRFLVIAGIGIAALAAAAAVVWAGAATGLYTLDEALRVGAGWPFILLSSAGAVAAWIALDRRARVPRGDGAGAERAAEVPYGPLDRALHDLAFATTGQQRQLAALETRLYRRRIDPARAERPVFVTSLPRAGTTILLHMLARCPELVSASYRHMPFTLAPLLWGGFSSAFRRPPEVSERAHGDGIDVGVDSPEAFEEMVWLAFWPDHYRRDHIRPWPDNARDAEFEAFFRTHLAKVVATEPAGRRYLSKNNANIARLGLLEAMHPDACIVVPLRDPAAQVASLVRQHRRFLALHARDPFARRYMEGLGHFEFGAALRPIAFDGSAPDPAGADDADFWLRYWISAYDHVLSRAGGRVILVDHDALCRDPVPGLEALATALELDAPGALTDQAGTLRPPPPAPTLPAAQPALMRQARELHAELRRHALVRETAPRSA